MGKRDKSKKRPRSKVSSTQDKHSSFAYLPNNTQTKGAIRSFLKRHWGILSGAFVAAATILGFFLDIGGLYSSLQNKLMPKVELAFFEEDKDGHLEIISPNDVQLSITFEDVISNRISFPVNLAIRNNEDKPLDVVRIEIRYDNTFEVESSAKAKIGPQNRMLIYEHDIGILENIDVYTPLQTIDIIHVPYKFLILPMVVLTKDGVPLYFLEIAGMGERFFSDKVFRFQITVFCKDRPPVKGIVDIRIPPRIQDVPWYRTDPSIVKPSLEEIVFF